MLALRARGQTGSSGQSKEPLTIRHSVMRNNLGLSLVKSRDITNHIIVSAHAKANKYAKHEAA